jgi:hypothetical protein
MPCLGLESALPCCNLTFRRFTTGVPHELIHDDPVSDSQLEEFNSRQL